VGRNSTSQAAPLPHANHPNPHSDPYFPTLDACGVLSLSWEGGNALFDDPDTFPI